MKFQDIRLSVLFLREGKKFIAYSPALDISTCADNFEDAKKNFEDLVEIFFDELEEAGTLEEVLTECGWRRVSRGKSRWLPPRIVGRTEETFKVPCPA